MTKKSSLSIGVLLSIGALLFLLPITIKSGIMTLDPMNSHGINTELFGWQYLGAFIAWGFFVFCAFFIFVFTKTPRGSKFVIILVATSLLMSFIVIGLAFTSWNLGWLAMLVTSVILFLLTVTSALYALRSWSRQ